MVWKFPIEIGLSVIYTKINIIYFFYNLILKKRYDDNIPFVYSFLLKDRHDSKPNIMIVNGIYSATLAHGI